MPFIYLFIAVTDVKVWVLDRTIFQAIMMKTGLQRQEENVNFLKRYAESLLVYTEFILVCLCREL